MFCTNCGSEIKDGSAFCLICGSRITTPKEFDKQTSEETQSRSVNLTESTELSKNINNTSYEITANSTQTSLSTDYSALQTDTLVYNQYTKKKSKRPFVIIGAVIIVIIIIAVNWDKNDYIGTVKQHKPFSSYAISCSIEDVFNKYTDSPSWRNYESNGTMYVKIDGKLIGLGDIEAIFSVVEEEEVCYINLRSILLDGNAKYTGDDAVDILYTLFDAYRLGYPTISQYISS